MKRQLRAPIHPTVFVLCNHPVTFAHPFVTRGDLDPG